MNGSNSYATWAWMLIVAVMAAGACTSNIGRDGSAGELPTPSSTAGQADVKSRTELEGNWSLVALEGAPISVPTERARPSLSFDPETNRVSGMAGVNRFGGPYEVGTGTLRLGPLMVTKMAGPPELNELETRFLRALERVMGWRMDRGELELLNGEQVLARFAPKS